MTTSNHLKRALVTGGNRGIGFAICQGLLDAGFEVILAARTFDKAKAAISRLKSDGNIHAAAINVIDDNSILDTAMMLSKDYGSLDVLINNAGIYPDHERNILTAERNLLMMATNTNAFSAIRLVQAFLPMLEKSPAARVINMSSIYGQLTSLSADIPGYCLSELALNGSTIMLADALKPKGISVYAVNPGWVRTDMGGESAPRSPQEGADTAVWLATEAEALESGKFWGDRKILNY